MPTVNPKALKRFRKLKGLNQEDVARQLAEKLNIKFPVSTYSSKENRGDFSEEEINIIAGFIGIKPDSITIAEPQFLGNDTRVNTDSYTVTNLLKIESMLRVLLRANAELIAAKRNQPIEDVMNNLLKDVEDEIRGTWGRLK
jgi:transcriptional regulator with XRE-family HTH domain